MNLKGGFNILRMNKTKPWPLVSESVSETFISKDGSGHLPLNTSIHN